MRNTTRRYLAVFMALVISISLSFNLRLPAQAAGDVDYVYASGYIKNWGVREELATFLSPNAEKFYDDNNITLNELLELDGSSNTSSVPSSELYKKLQALMKSNHTHETNYGETRYQFPHTDCQNSGKTSNKISSFYSGKEIGPNWDSGNTWNREHTWPNSKGNMAGNGENDIMMLRPTASSENGSRGNRAYGESGSYYDPNSESDGKLDLRGDVSRIILYQYVRWGCTKASDNKGNWHSIWGSTGLIESKELLLEWMEEDPVDTWELGRNDSVESITGTRNVFVDFPELAFDLFNEDIPNNYKTPSSSTTSSGYKITATSNNTAWGKVSVNRDTIIASSVIGYEAVDFTIISGNATVERTGDDFKVNTSGDVTIQINFAPLCTVKFVEDGESARTMTKYQNGSITLPAHKTAIKSGYTFLGWTTSPFGDTDKKPFYSAVGDKYTVTENTSLYALYSRKANGKVVYFTNSPTDCTHQMAYKVPRVEPTCQSAGTTEGIYCPDCKVFTSGYEKISNNGIEHKYNNKGICSVCGDAKAVGSSKPSTDTSNRGEQNVNNKPTGNTSSKDEQNASSKNEQDTSSILTETEDVSVTVNISESTIVSSDFIEEAVNNNIPLILKAKDYTWSFEKILLEPVYEVKNFDAAIYLGDEVSEGHTTIIKDAAKGKSFFPISFAHSGALPARATITVKVDEALAGREVEVYSITASGSTVLECKATVKSDATLTFKTERTSLYFITDAAATDNRGAFLWLWITIAVVLAGGAVVIFILYKKKIIFEKA